MVAKIVISLSHTHHTHARTHARTHTHTHTHRVSLYGAPLAQTAFYLALHNFLFNCLLIGSRCIPNGTTLTIAEPIWPRL